MKRNFNIISIKIPLISFFSVFTAFYFIKLQIAADNKDQNRITPTVRAVAKVMPSIVNMSTEKIVTKTMMPQDGSDHFDSIFSPYLSKQKKEESYSLGSGCVIDPSGLIVTNAHVVHRATVIHVTLSDGRRFLAREIASANLNDLALLQLMNLPPGTRLQPIDFAEVGDLYLGETVIAVGNPYGLGNSISKGVLSAIGRQAEYNGKVVLSNILQTDAAINPGSSGGPLININGEMIGVNIAIHKEAMGIGFAIPLERVENLLAKWLVPERFGNFALGIVPGTRRNAQGKVEIFIANVFKDSPAWKAGLRSYYLIKKVNGKKVDKLIDLSRYLCRLKGGDKISLTTANEKVFHLQVENITHTDGKLLARLRLGLGLQELSSSLAESLGYPFRRGIIISDNLSGNSGIRRSDMLVRLGDVPIYSFTDIARALRDKHYGDKIAATIISVYPKDKHYYLMKKVIGLSVK